MESEIGRLRREDWKFEGEYMVWWRDLRMLAYICHPAPWKTEAKGSKV